MKEFAPKSKNLVKIKAFWNFNTGVYSCKCDVLSLPKQGC